MNWEIVKFASAAVSGCLTTLAVQKTFRNKRSNDKDQQVPIDEPSVLPEDSQEDNTDSGDTMDELVRVLHLVGRDSLLVLTSHLLLLANTYA